jgi:UDP-N-acetylenolpyruvoylglucosamine reductase
LKKLYPEIPFWKVPADISCRDASLTPPNGESVNYDQKEIVKLSAGRLIEQSGLKGYWTGKVGTFPKNALVLINASGTADEVLAVVDHIQQTVKEKFEIELQPEAVYVH